MPSPNSVWTTPEFNDSSWTSVPVGVGYDLQPADGDFGSLILPGGELTTMAGTASSAWLRTEFDWQDATALDRLDLSLNYDDGYVAYLNGTQVASQNAPNDLSWDSTATQQNGGVTDVVSLSDFSDPAVRSQLNLLDAANWQGDRLELTPAEVDRSGAAWTNDTVTFASDYSFSASMVINIHSPGGSFDSDGRGGHGMTFVIQSGGANRLGGPAGELGLDSTGMSFVAVEFDTFDSGSFDDDDSPGAHLGIDTSRDGSVAEIQVPRFSGSFVTAGQPGPGVDLRHVWVEYTGPTQQMDVYFSSDDVKPAEPTLSADVDLASLFGDVTDLWLGWTAATGAAYNAHDVRQFELTTGAGQLGLTPESINLTSKQDLLRDGKNVLAIHGLNVAVGDDDFLLKPTLTGYSRAFGDRKYFSPPTPGDVNGVGDEAPSGPIEYSVTTKTFVDPFQLELTASAPGAEIRYTTDGSLPDESSMLYAGPIAINGSTRIRARSFEAGKGAGPVRSEGFIALGGSVTNFESGQMFNSNLPVMVFESFGRRVEGQDTNMVPVTGVFINPGEDGRAAILEEGEFAGRGGLRIRGQTSQGFDKKQFALELWDEFNSDERSINASRAPDKAASFFGLPAESDWVLNGPYSDKTQLNNYLTFLWSNNAGTYAPRATLVEVFLNQDGGAVSYPNDYRGTYVLLEKIKIDSNRVDIESLSPDDNSEPAITGGYIWKKDKAGAGDEPFSTSRGQELRMVEPDDASITTTQKNWLRDHINDFERALYGADFADPELGYANYIDVGSWVDTWLLVEMTKNIDGFRLSTYYYKDREGKINQGPAWDYNLSLGNGNYLRGAYPEGWYHDGLDSNTYPYWDRLFQDPNFNQAVVDRWHELRETVWSTDSLLGDIDAAVNALSDNNPRLDDPAPGERSNPISRNFDKWDTVDRYLWPNCFFGSGSCPRSPLPGGGRPSEYGDYIFIMRDFVSRRVEWMDSQLPRGPLVTPEAGMVAVGTSLTIDVPNGWTAVYTVDGSDPRSSDSAVTYVQPIVITENTSLNARLRRNDEWSGLTNRLFVVEQTELAITELHYHPADPTVQELTAIPTVGADDFEFIELTNLSAEPAQLVGMQFTNGVDFTFGDATLAPAEYGVVVRNEAAFRLRYGEEVRVLGQYAGSLANGGERLTLSDPFAAELWTMTYSDGALWPQAADGVGASLEAESVILTSDALPPRRSKSTSWRASVEFGGSPGRASAAPFMVRINEVVSNSSDAMGDSVELYNAGEVPVDLGGWYLSDSSGNLRKYRIADGVMLPANQYLVLTEADFNPTPDAALPTHFALSGTAGDDVWLTIGGDESVSHFVDDVHFGPTIADSSLGRSPNGQGVLTPMTQPTLGAANSTPLFSPVMITELMVKSPSPILNAITLYPELDSNDLEFVELTNVSGVPVDLTNWRLRGDFDFEMPAGMILSPAESILLTSFDPDSPENANRVAAFRVQYGLTQATRLLGGYPGELEDGEGRLVLQRPDKPLPDDPNVTPRVSADEVIYDDLSPWPEPVEGFSLQRSSDRTLGSVAASWITATPNVGMFDVGSVPGDLTTDGIVDQLDIGALCAALLAGDQSATFDLNGDSRVDSSDRDFLVRDILRTDYGDANLDGLFDSTDLVLAFQAGEYEDAGVGNSGWEAAIGTAMANSILATSFLPFKQAATRREPSVPRSLPCRLIKPPWGGRVGRWRDLRMSRRVCITSVGAKTDGELHAVRSMCRQSLRPRDAPTPPRR